MPGTIARATRTGAAVLAAGVLCAGCGVLTEARIPAGAGDAAPDGGVAELAVDPDRPVLLRGVDRRLVSGIHVSNRLRAVVYLVPAGPRELWLSDVPFGLPLLPQRMHCYVMKTTLVAGTRYTLVQDSRMQAPVLDDPRGGPRAVGTLVDAPSIMERSCRWP